MDILEHMSDPAKLLNLASKYVKKNGFIIISTPNIAFLSVRLSLMFGNFNYRDTGIMDRGHKHFFTKKTLSELVKQSHLKILSIDYSSGFSQIPFIGKYINRISKYHQYQITRIFGTLLGYQIILVSQK
jgi:2-polyprenyl-3-methyl-5-hydroxy-6-metoxy-1,4-benzoquinol methylase